MPTGWTVAGNNPEGYDIGSDTLAPHGGRRSGMVQWTPRAKPDQFATLMQTVSADSFRGKRVRLRAFVRVENVAEYAGLWLRLDGPERIVGFDNMSERPVVGSRDWARYSIVLDVPGETLRVAFGVNLRGRGQVWIDDCVFDFVDNTVVVTGVVSEFLLKAPVRSLPPIPGLHSTPENLDFEK
jgi:hypothetical protein